jgi:hypothetical protein
MPLKLRPTGLGSGIDKDRPDYTVYCGEWRVGGAVDDALFEEVAKPIARRFGVSPQAMRLRLEKLGLLLRQAPQQASLTVDP